MGKANLYTVKDYLTGEVLAKGTAGELEASGIVPKGYHTSEWAKHENQKRRNRKYAISFRGTAAGSEARRERPDDERLHLLQRSRRRNRRRHRKGAVGGGRLQQRQRGLLYLQRTGRALHKARHREK
mgnify:CR=1 FL=1